MLIVSLGWVFKIRKMFCMISSDLDVNKLHG